MNLENIELKPCPFCGGKAEIWMLNENGQSCRNALWAKDLYIKCSTCHAASDTFEKTIDKNALEQAVSAWNQRKKDSIISDEAVSEVENAFIAAGDQLSNVLNELCWKVKTGGFKEEIRAIIEDLYAREDNNEETVHIPADSDPA